MPSLLERLRHLPGDSIVYHTAITQDAAGFCFIDSAQSVPLIVSAANAPIYVMDDVDLGRGTVGGYLISWEADARVAARIASQSSRRRGATQYPNRKEQQRPYSIGAQCWGLKEEDLPPGSTILFEGYRYGAHKMVLDWCTLYHSQPLRSCNLFTYRPETIQEPQEMRRCNLAAY